MSLREMIGRPIALLVGTLAVVWVVVWVLGWTISWRLVLVLACGGIVLMWLVHMMEAPLTLLPWPDPSPASPQRWFGLDPDVRRLAHQVQDSLDGPEAADRLRAQLRDELARRLVARHGASPEAPLAQAEPMLGPVLWQALQPDARRKLNRTTLNQLLRRIEEL